ncbi:hypothetical protein GCM10011452_03960 [Gemmobacter lanyuensis]|uniref:Hedgehog/Intein (Hint) domain-containing protein n=1 Tax=Gemmobacter lanyuensis TaxID=1054497 RepID=A0A918INZ6_9RHOB|nr:Hint domain-containing protein [Gemmobacter lanyuensis]GGW21874.1 hypothetical protein GCM10011452_03960 [Gemmobacter lanyuensis]
MPVFALYNFDDATSAALDSASTNGAQDGIYLNGAASNGSQAVLDGADDLVKIYPDASFQMDRGTLDIRFTSSTTPQEATQTILSRDSIGQTDGGFRIQLLADGAIQITHESAAGDVVYTTEPGFSAPGDEIQLSYSWDVASGGQLSIANATAGTTFGSEVPAGLTMDQGESLNQPWIVGAGQTASNPGLLNDIDQHFAGSVDMFQLSDSVDNLPDRDGYVDGTAGDDLIDLAYTGDPDGDRIDANDAILPGDTGDEDRVRAGAGNDTVLAGNGDDTVWGGTGADSISGGAGADSLMGEDGDDYIAGQRGMDTLIGGQGNDTLVSGAEDDQIYGGDGRDSVIGNSGSDLIDTAGGVSSPDRDYPDLYAADADPEDDRDYVFAGAGNDTIRTGDDADTIYGGGGTDLIQSGDDDDIVTANADNDTVEAGEGADLVTGDLGDDLIYGGTADLSADPTHLTDDVDPDPDNNRDQLFGGLGNDTIYGQDDDDTLVGGYGDDVLDGGIDEDSMLGSQGNDTLIGGQGADTMSGGADRDVFVVSAPGDGIGDVIDGNELGDDYDTLNLTGSGPFVINYDPTNAENGTVDFMDREGNVTGTLTFSNIENIIPCFTPGTLIATPRGEIPVEQLQAGDRVITRDNGIQQVRWVGQKQLSWADLSLNPHLKPILIRKGSLGNGLPEQDMMVSPNHRVLVANDRTALYFDEHEVLVAAKHLVAGRGVHEVDSMGTTYIHFMFDRHEVVLSNGAWTESFQPGDYTLKGMGNAQRNEIYELFPDLKTETGREAYGAARRTLKKHEAKLLVK